jgi:bifunctional non-homologous end joining protein LigD
VHQASFKGLREDKRPEEVVEEGTPGREEAASPTTLPEEPARPPRKAATHSNTENVQRLLADAVAPSPEALGAYWRKVGKAALVHLGRRPLTLVRHDRGRVFFHEGTLPETPAAVHRLTMTKGSGEQGTRLWVDSVEGLIGLTEIGVIEIHPWGSRVDDIERPDMLVLDLDPGEGVGWEFVTDTALRMREMLITEGLLPDSSSAFTPTAMITATGTTRPLLLTFT